MNVHSPWTVWTPANEDATITAMEKLRQYCTRIPTIPTEGRGNTSWRSITFIPLLAERISIITIVLYGCSFSNGYDINTLRMNYFYISFCGDMKHVLRLRVCSSSTAVTCGKGIILMLSANVGIKDTSASIFVLESSRTLSCAPICYLTAQLYHDFLETCQPGLLEDVPLAVRQKFWFQHDGAPVGKTSRSS
jgi:hypothetical protein